MAEGTQHKDDGTSKQVGQARASQAGSGAGASGSSAGVGVPGPKSGHKPKAPKPTVVGAPVVERKKSKKTSAAASASTAKSAAVAGRASSGRPSSVPSPKEGTSATPTGSPKARGTVATSPKVKTGGVKYKVQAVKTVAAQDREADKKSIGQARRSVLFLAVVMVAYILYLVFSGQFDEFLVSLSQVDQTWIYRGMLCYLLYYVLGVSAYVFSVVIDPDSPVGLRDLMSVEASGIFFMNLTPNGVGAAPAQIYRLTRSGLTVGGASALQSTRFIIYEASEGIFAALMLVFRMDYFVETFDNVFLLGAILFGFKILECVALMIICLYPKLVTKGVVAGMNFLGRKGWLKDSDKKRDQLVEQINEFARGFKRASQNVPEMIAILILTMLQLACLYALPWFVLQAFEKDADLITCMASGSMLELLTSAIPLPGGTGGAEGGFALLFGGMFEGEAAAGYVLWRAIEYFLPTLCAAPLLGLRSKSGESLNHRANRWKAKFSRLFGRKGRTSSGSGNVGGSIKVKVRRRR